MATVAPISTATTKVDSVLPKPKYSGDIPTLVAAISSLDQQIENPDFVLTQELIPALQRLTARITGLPGITLEQPRHSAVEGSPFAKLKTEINNMHMNRSITGIPVSEIENKVTLLIATTAQMDTQYKNLFENIQKQTKICEELQAKGISLEQQIELSRMTTGSVEQMKWVFSNKALINNQDWKSALDQLQEVQKHALGYWINASEKTKSDFAEAVATSDIDFSPSVEEILRATLTYAIKHAKDVNENSKLSRSERLRLITKPNEEGKTIDWSLSQETHHHLVSEGYEKNGKKHDSYDNLASLQYAVFNYFENMKKLLSNPPKLSPPKEYYRKAILQRREDFLKQIEQWIADSKVAWNTETKAEDEQEGLVKEINYFGEMAESQMIRCKYTFMSLPGVGKLGNYIPSAKSYYQLWDENKPKEEITWKRGSPFDADFVPKHKFNIEQIVKDTLNQKEKSKGWQKQPL